MLRPRLSLCLIVKNEENHLDLCLQDAHHYCDEVIVVDTGSTDRTIEIARSAGAKVVSFTWINDFSAARNFSLRQATGEWILVLDADERLSPESWPLVRQAIESTSASYFHLSQINYSFQTNLAHFEPNQFHFDGYASYPGYTVSWLARLFRNDGSFEFRGPVHEHLHRQGKALPSHPLQAFIHNHGMALPEDQLKEKKKLYLEIGKKKADENPNDFTANLELGIAYWETDNLQAACDYFERAYRIDPKSLRLLIAYGSVKRLLGQTEEAGHFFRQAVDLYRTDPYAHASLGRIHQDQKDYDAALREYQIALLLKPQQPAIHALLAQCFEEAGKVYPDRKPTLSACLLVLEDSPALTPLVAAALSVAEEVVLLCLTPPSSNLSVAASNRVRIYFSDVFEDNVNVRNTLIRLAVQEWVLFLTSKESMDVDDLIKLREFLQDRSRAGFMLEGLSKKDQSLGQFGRLFRNWPDLRFTPASPSSITAASSDLVLTPAPIRFRST